jgi:hypothetical protein
MAQDGEPLQDGALKSTSGPAPLILNFKVIGKNTLKGFFDLELPSGMILAGCQLHQKNESKWIGLPARPYTTDAGTQTWTKIVDFRDKQTRDRFQDSVTPLAIAAYERARTP